MPDISPFLKFSSHTLQEIALVFMATVYVIRVIWFLRHKPAGERQARGQCEFSGTPTLNSRGALLRGRHHFSRIENRDWHREQRAQ